MDPQRTLRLVVPLGLVVGVMVPVVILVAHAYRRSQAREQQALLLAQEQAEITLRLEGLLYSATKRARDCRIDEAADYRRRAQELNTQIASRKVTPPPSWSVQLAELSALLADCDAAAHAEEDARMARERSRLAAISRLEQAFTLCATNYDFAGMEAIIANPPDEIPVAGELIDHWRMTLDTRRQEWDLWQDRIARWSAAASEFWYMFLDRSSPLSFDVTDGG